MKNIAINCVITLFSLTLTISTLEIGARWYANETKNVYSFENFLFRNIDIFHSGPRAKFDLDLGWIPREGLHSSTKDTKANILEDGIRSNGGAVLINNDKVVLAVGDSFTFGDDVFDHETWPAILESLSNTKVFNGGVFGYGIDQIFLRMKTLVGKYSPSIVVFSFIAADVDRSGYSEFLGVPKPYFVLSKGGELNLRKDHITSYSDYDSPIDSFRNIFGYSFLIHKLMTRLFPEYWLLGYKEHSTNTNQDILRISCGIFQRLATYAQETQIQIYILVQYTFHDLIPRGGLSNDFSQINTVVSCIDQKFLQLIDTRNELVALNKQDAEQLASLYQGHMTRSGNEFIASILWKEIDW